VSPRPLSPRTRRTLLPVAPVSVAAYSPSPSGRGRGEGRIEPWKALVGANLPYTDAKTALGCLPSTGSPTAVCRGGGLHKYQWHAGDGLQRPLRFRCQPRLTPGAHQYTQREERSSGASRGYTSGCTGGGGLHACATGSQQTAPPVSSPMSGIPHDSPGASRGGGRRPSAVFRVFVTAGRRRVRPLACWSIQPWARRRCAQAINRPPWDGSGRRRSCGWSRPPPACLRGRRRPSTGWGPCGSTRARRLCAIPPWR